MISEFCGGGRPEFDTEKYLTLRFAAVMTIQNALTPKVKPSREEAMAHLTGLLASAVPIYLAISGIRPEHIERGLVVGDSIFDTLLARLMLTLEDFREQVQGKAFKPMNPLC